MIFFSLIALLNVFEIVDYHTFIISIAPLTLIITFVKIRAIWRSKDLPGRKQKVTKILTNSHVLDAVSLSLASILFFSVKYISSFKYLFCLGPMVLASFIITVKMLVTKKAVYFE